MKDETLRSAFQGRDVLSATQDVVIAYESRLKQVLDEEAARKEAETLYRHYFGNIFITRVPHLEGSEAIMTLAEMYRKQGIEQERKDNAKVMLKKGYSKIDIMELSKLSKEEIEALEKEI